jgi:hypothetical protein
VAVLVEPLSLEAGWIGLAPIDAPAEKFGEISMRV